MNGRYGTATPQSATVNVNKIGTVDFDSLNSNYLSQTYSVTSNIAMGGYEITGIAGFPSGTIITDMSNNTKTEFSAGDRFKVLIPVSSISNLSSNFTGVIAAQAKCKTYPIFYGISPNSAWQDFACTFDPYGDESGIANLDIKVNNCRLQIKKIDAETKQNLAGVKFEVRTLAGALIGTYTTDNNGVADIKDLFPNAVKITEVETQKEYILNTTSQQTTLEWGKTVSVQFENYHKKGNIKVYKVDKDNKKVILGNVEFDLYSVEFDKIIGTYTTDVNGEIFVKDLRTGNYKLIEKTTNRWYDLAEDTTVLVEWNTTKDTTIENELKKGQVKIIKVDLDNNEVKLEGVKFEVLDEQNKVLETITTDKNGEATTSRYAVRDFEKLTLCEVETKENYVLNKEPQTIVLEQDQITDFTFYNERIKGQIEITKISAEDNQYSKLAKGSPLEGVVFEIYNEAEELVDTVTTDLEGKATSKFLYKGKYFIKEVQGNTFYLLKTDMFEVEIKEHLKVEEITIENDNVEIELEVEKTGLIQAQPLDEIRYDFPTVANKSNVPLDDFTFIDNLPYEYINMKYLFTGIYSHEVELKVYYKTNLTEDYTLLKENISSKANTFIDFTTIDLAEGEYITNYKIYFGTVPVGFKAETTPFMFAQVREDVEDNDTWINEVELSGEYAGVKVEDQDDWETKTYKKELKIKKLPRTGM